MNNRTTWPPEAMTAEEIDAIRGWAERHRRDADATAMALVATLACENVIPRLLYEVTALRTAYTLLAEQLVTMAEAERIGGQTMERRLTEGAAVHYVAYNQRHPAALVTGVYTVGADAGTVDLAVFTNMENVAGEKSGGVQFHFRVRHAPTAEPGTWHWLDQGEAGH